MRTLNLATLIAAVFITNAFTLRLLPRQDTSLALVELHTYKRSVADPFTRDALRRRQTVSETLDNEITLYFANISIGTPPQNVRLSIDTGSSDLWANTPSSQICQSRGNPCSLAGTYDANSSSTYKYVASNFNVAYADGSGAAGDYATDVVSIGGKNLSNLQLGIGYSSALAQGILGIGYTADESQTNSDQEQPYANTPQAMVNAGLIKSNSYSLWLNDLEENTGSILFGGVDTAKYTGTLNTLPTQKIFNRYAEFLITLTGTSIVNNGKTTNYTQDLPTAVILDSGSSLTYLPDALLGAMYTALQVQFDEREGNAFANCDLANEKISVDFTFTSFTISVPISELIINANQGDSSSFSNAGSCIFGIGSSQGSTAVLGDTFLRSAYVVYDLANNEISMAQTDFNATSSNVQEIGTGAGSVPGAVSVSNAVQASVSQSGGARGPGITASASMTAGSPSSTSKSGSYTTEIPWAILICILGAAFALLGS